MCLTSQGVKSDPSKVQAIHDMPVPTSSADVQRLNGMVKYLTKIHSKFVRTECAS